MKLISVRILFTATARPHVDNQLPGVHRLELRTYPNNQTIKESKSMFLK